MSFYRNSTVLVLVILVDVYPVAQGIHGDAGGMAKIIAILQSAHDDAGEDVAGARELNRDFFVGQEEILFCKMIETYHGILNVPTKAGKYPAILKVPGAGVRPYGGDEGLVAELVPQDVGHDGGGKIGGRVAAGHVRVGQVRDHDERDAPFLRDDRLEGDQVAAFQLIQRFFHDGRAVVIVDRGAAVAGEVLEAGDDALCPQTLDDDAAP